MVEATVKKPAAKKVTKATPEGTFAIFATGGKQYKVSAGDTVRIEKIGDEHKEGDKLVFDNVLLVDDPEGKRASNGAGGLILGTPFIEGARVNATLTKIGRLRKVTTIKYKQKSRYFKKYGHRQPFFEITIDSIK